MLRLIVFALVAGIAVQAWRQYPADGPLTADAAMTVSVLGLAVSFLAGLFVGRRRGGAATATATSTASAESSSDAAAGAAAVGNSLHVNVFSRDLAGARPVGLTVPDAPSWRGEAPLLTSEQVGELLSEGADLAELGLLDEMPEVRG